MADWKKDELQKISKSDDLHIAPLREDGVTFGTPTWIWSVVVGGALYVRAYNGKKSRWYNAAIVRKRGQILVAGKTIDVSFEVVDGDFNAAIDAAYRVKYGESQYLKPMISERARGATVRIVPT